MVNRQSNRRESIIRKLVETLNAILYNEKDIVDENIIDELMSECMCSRRTAREYLRVAKAKVGI